MLLQSILFCMIASYSSAANIGLQGPTKDDTLQFVTYLMEI